MAHDASKNATQLQVAPLSKYTNVPFCHYHTIQANCKFGARCKYKHTWCIPEMIYGSPYVFQQAQELCQDLIWYFGEMEKDNKNINTLHAAHVHMHFARTLAADGNRPLATKHFHKALTYHDSGAVHYSFGKFLREDPNTFTLAEYHLQKAVVKNPHNKWYCWHLASFLVAANRHQEAIIILEKSVRDHPHHWKGWYFVACAVYFGGNYLQYPMGVEACNKCLKMIANWRGEWIDNKRTRLEHWSRAMSPRKFHGGSDDASDDLKFNGGSQDLIFKSGSGPSRFNNGGGSSRFNNGSGSSRFNNGSDDSIFKSGSSGSSRVNNGSGSSRFNNGSGSSRVNNGSGSSRVNNGGSGSSRVNNGSGPSRFNNGGSGSSRVNNGSGLSRVNNGGSGSSRVNSGSGDLRQRSFNLWWELMPLPNRSKREYLLVLRETKNDWITLTGQWTEELLRNECNMPASHYNIVEQERQELNAQQLKFSQWLKTFDWVVDYENIFERNGITTFAELYRDIESPKALEVMLSNDSNANYVSGDVAKMWFELPRTQRLRQ